MVRVHVPQCFTQRRTASGITLVPLIMNEPAEHRDILKHGTQAELFPDLQAGVPETWQMETLRAQLAKMQKQLDDVTEASQHIAEAVLMLTDQVEAQVKVINDVQAITAGALENLLELHEQHDQKIKDLHVLTLDIKL